MKSVAILSAFVCLCLHAASQTWQHETLPVVNNSTYFQIYRMDAAPNGDVVCNTSEGLLLKQNGVWSVLSAPIPVYGCFFDYQGTLWINDLLGAVYRYDGVNWHLNVSPLNIAYSVNLAKDENGEVWVSESDGNITHYARCLSDSTKAPVLLPTTEFHVASGLFYSAGLIGLSVIDHLGVEQGSIVLPFSEMVSSARVLADGRLVLRSTDVFGSDSSVHIVDGLQKDSIYLGPNEQLQTAQNKIFTSGHDASVISQYDPGTGATQLINVDYNGPLAAPKFFAVNNSLYAYYNSIPTGSPAFVLSHQLQPANRIEGVVFADENNNGIMDGSEFGLSNRILQLSPSGMYTATAADGSYTFYVNDTAGTHVVAANAFSPNWQAPATATVTQTTAGQISDNVNFGFTPLATISDVAVSATSTAVRPGMITGFWITVSNNGTTSYNGTLTANLDGLLSMVHSSWPVAVNAGNAFTFAVPTVAPLGSVSMFFTALVETTAVMGDTLHVTLNAANAADVAPADNAFTLSRLVTASYDPNDKAVLPAGLGPDHLTPAGTELRYTVRFQNTGNDTAFTVVIRDTIAAQFLDMSSFKIIGSSHTCQLEMNGFNALAFRFNNILLPDSNSNEPLSHGFVQYAIKVKDDAPDGSLIQNTAFIYFDYNDAVVTNTTTNLIGEPNAVVETNEAPISIFPNPAFDYIVVQPAEGIDVVTVYNVLGESVSVTKASGKVDVSKLLPGLYFVEVTKASAKHRLSFVRQ